MMSNKIRAEYGVESGLTGKELLESLYKNVRQFEYIESDAYRGMETFLKQTKVCELESKHYIVLNDKTAKVRELGVNAGNPNILWGYYRNATAETERNAILEMARVNFRRPSRIVIDKMGRIWGDNTHTLLSWMYRLGKDVTLYDIPIYMVDTRKDVNALVNINNTVNGVLNDMKMAVACGIRINYYNSMGLRPLDISWTLGDLAENTGLFNGGN